MRAVREDEDGMDPSELEKGIKGSDAEAPRSEIVSHVSSDNLDLSSKGTGPTGAVNLSLPARAI
jgi:hypothetical protein